MGMTGPSVLFGAIAKNTDWAGLGYECGAPTDKCDEGDVGYPLCTEHTPTKVCYFNRLSLIPSTRWCCPWPCSTSPPRLSPSSGLAPSPLPSCPPDSSMLSASTMIARNFYQKVIRPNCSEKEVIWALWVCIIINCVIATSLAITYRSIYDLFVLCGDFMLVIVFPQLTLVLYWELANTYGSVFSFVVGLVLRLMCGDKTMGIPAAIEFGTIKAACPTEADPDKMCGARCPSDSLSPLSAPPSTSLLAMLPTLSSLGARLASNTTSSELSRRIETGQ